MQATIPVTEPLIFEKSAPEGPVANSGAAPTLQALRVRRTASLLTLAIVITGGLSVWYILSSRFEATDNAFVEASVHPVSSRVAGDVVEVLVDDNQAVTLGQVLARLDPRDCVLKVHAAEADLACASADILQAHATVDMARARLKESAAQTDTSAAQQEKTRLDRERAERLFQGANRAISKQEFDSAQAAFDVASGSLGVAMAGQEAATASLEAARGALAASEAREMSAKAALENAKLQLSFTEILAAESGRIAKKNLETGQRVQSGQPLLAIVSERCWIVANFKENQMDRIRPGQLVEIRVDALRGKCLHGKVESIAPGTGAKFSLLPPDNATGNFLKIVQRIPVKILLADGSDPDGRLRPGLSVTARVRVAE